MNQFLLISDAAKEVNVETHVLRYWEEELHLPIKRNELGHRYYTREDVEQFKQIKSMKERGLQLKAIKTLIKNGRFHLEKTAPKVEEVKQTKEESEESGYSIEPVDEKGKENEHFGIEIGNEEQTFQGIVNVEEREEKTRRLQWLLQQLIRETLQENNEELARLVRESVIKELDYQFRLQEEREEERDKNIIRRNEEYYQKMDELLRIKTKLGGRNNRRNKDEKKRHSIF